MLAWLRKRRRRKLMQGAFSEDRRRILEKAFPGYSMLAPAEKQQLEGLILVFISEKRIEGAGGFEVTDAVRVWIAAHACRMILNLSFEYFSEVETVIVYPCDVRRPKPLLGDRHTDGELAFAEMPVAGEAIHGGPVLLSWDAVNGGAVHPEDGLNVIIHEFAHKIDMRTGEADGLPPLKKSADIRTWAKVCGREFRHLSRRTVRGLESFLDDYAAEHPAEFFAVACEYFFEKSAEMKRKRPALYAVFADFFHQDPARKSGG